MIFRKSLFIEIVIIAVLIAILHYAATVFSLYWSIVWFDILMHFLGGLFIGLLALYLFFTSGLIKYPCTHKIVVFSVVVGSVLVVGLTWELWELFVGLSDVLSDQGDTVLDLILDIFGAVVAYMYGVKRVWLEN